MRGEGKGRGGGGGREGQSKIRIQCPKKNIDVILPDESQVLNWIATSTQQTKALGLGKISIISGWVTGHVTKFNEVFAILRHCSALRGDQSSLEGDILSLKRCAAGRKALGAGNAIANAASA